MDWLVGDIQGCDAALERLLLQIGFSASRDRLWSLGDVVNRGPDSLACLRRLRALDAKVVLGNHDLHLLAVAAGTRTAHRSDTLESLLAAYDRNELLAWLRGQALVREVEGWLLVHAGLLPAWRAQDALRLGAEVQALVAGADWQHFLPQMYGNDPDAWDESLTGPARWRCLINAFTRLRFITPDGRMDFVTKEGAGAAPADYLPWFDVADRQSTGQPIAFGHWSTLGLIDRPELLALDTGCVWGGCLSAARIDGGRREIVQISCEQAQVPGAM
jgi:bis(5'-nucleosyl)-tetraphosphatase (symmetrical)